MAYFAVIAAWTGEKDLALQQLATAAPTYGAAVIASYGMLKLFALLGPASRRSALRANRRLLRAEKIEQKLFGQLPPLHSGSAPVRSDVRSIPEGSWLPKTRPNR